MPSGLDRIGKSKIELPSEATSSSKIQNQTNHEDTKSRSPGIRSSSPQSIEPPRHRDEPNPARTRAAGRKGRHAAALARAGRTARTLSSRLWAAPLGVALFRPVGPSLVDGPLGDAFRSEGAARRQAPALHPSPPVPHAPPVAIYDWLRALRAFVVKNARDSGVGRPFAPWCLCAWSENRKSRIENRKFTRLGVSVTRW